MDFEVYHDESQKDGYWHGMLFVPVLKKIELLNQLSMARVNINYSHYLSFKGLLNKRKSLPLELAETWIQIGLASMRARNKGFYPVFIGEKIGKKRTYIKNLPIIGTKLVIFRDTQTMQGLSPILDKGAKVETSFRVGFKGALHLLGNELKPINVTKIHFDGYEHYRRKIDEKRIIGRLRGLRPYVNIADSSCSIDDRSGNPHNSNPQSREDCELLQLIDILLGAFRTRFSGDKRDQICRITKPVIEIINRFEVGKPWLDNSIWKDSIMLSQYSIVDGKWVFEEIAIEKDYKQDRLFD